MKKTEIKTFIWFIAIFIAVYFMPAGKPVFTQAISEAFILLKWYAREHVLLCLVPAFFIAGFISVFISQASVIKYFGAQAKKWLAYTVASVSGAVLAVCSCTILPLFSGIYKRGAGLGPAIAFLYAGPAINILAIILTARILGFELGVARVIGAVLFSIVIGILMDFIYRKEQKEKSQNNFAVIDAQQSYSFKRIVFLFFTLVGILVIVNWGKTNSNEGIWFFIYANKWLFTGLLSLLLAGSLVVILKIRTVYVLAGVLLTGLVAVIFKNHLLTFITGVTIFSILLSFKQDDSKEWLSSTWGFTKQILPLLASGILVAGVLLGSPGGHGLIPENWIANIVGGNSVQSNFFASIVGAFMYFATLTEVPIVQGLIASGMGKGPALALLLAGPALSLPNMLVIRSVIGLKKTIVFVSLVVIMATISGLIFGSL